jgi:hypothetical protein
MDKLFAQWLLITVRLPAIYSGLKNDVAKTKLLPLLLWRRGPERGGSSVGFRAATVFMKLL